MSFDRSIFSIDCYTWKISIMLIGTSQLIK